MLKKIKKLKLSEIIFYICAFVMTFSVFMFFMSPLKWNGNKLFNDAPNPTFFNLIFSGEWSTFDIDWPVISGVVFMFIFQIILLVTLLTISVLLILKKIKSHTAICILIGISTLAIICGILSLCSHLMISKKYILPEMSEIISWKYGDYMKLNYGAYVYGITMISASLGSIVAFVLDHYNK